MRYFLGLSAYVTRKLEEAGESLETCVIVAAALYNRHVENFKSWSCYSGLGKGAKDCREFALNEFWLQFNQDRAALLKLMRAPYVGIADNALSPYMDGEKEPNVYSPLHLVVQSLVGDYPVTLLVFSH